MPEYIPQIPAGMLQELTRAKTEQAFKGVRSAQTISTAIADAVNKHYQNKELQLAQKKKEKQTELEGAIKYLSDNKLIEIPPGTTGQVSVEGAEPVPAGMADILRQQGMEGRYFSQPREKTYKPEDTIGEAVGKQLGLPAITGVKAAALTLKAKSDKLRFTIFSSRNDPAYAAISRQVQDIMKGAIDYKTLPDTEKAKINDWIKKTEDMGVNLTEYKKSIEALGQQPEEIAVEVSWLDKLKQKVFGNKPAAAPAAKPAPAASGQKNLPGME